MKRLCFFFLLFGYFGNIVAQESGLTLCFRGQYSDKTSAILKKCLAEKYSDTLVLKSRLNALVSELHGEGYLEAGIDSLQFNVDTVWAQLHLGKVYKWGIIKFKGWQSIESYNIDTIFKIKRRLPFNYAEFQQYQERILHDFENNGFPFVRIVPSDVQIKNERVNGTWEIFANRYYVWDSLLIKGTLNLDKPFLYRYLGIRPGKVFSQKKFKEIDAHIGRLSFVNEIKPAEVEFGEQKARVYTYLEKQPASQFDGILGLLSDNEKSGKLEVSGELKMLLVNSFGKGEYIRFNWQKIEAKTQKLSSRFQYPYLFNSSLGVDVGFKLRKQDTTFLNTETDFGVQFLAEGGNYLKLFIRLNNSSLLSTKSLLGATVLPDFADSRSLTYGAGLRYQNLDYIFNPRKGWNVTMQVGAGNRKVKTNSKLPSQLYEDVKLRSLLVDGQWDFSRYFSLTSHWVLKLRNTGGVLHNSNLFENDLYRFGGLKTIRGFDEEVFRASVYSVFNSELRFLPEKNTALFIFWDGAYYRKEIFSQRYDDTPWGIGIGASFQTGAGIFSLNYAVGKQKDQPIKIRSAKIHFGFISRF